MQELMRKLEKLGARATQVEEVALKKAGKIFEKEIIEQVPVDTGNLKDNIEIGDVIDEEFGQGKRIEVGTNTKDGFYGLFVEMGSAKGTKANPFMGRAYELKRAEAQRVIEAEVKKGLKI